MYTKTCLILSMCNIVIGSAKEDIVCQAIDGHHNHWGAEKEYNEQHRERLPESALIHNASTSIASQRTDRGAIDLPGVIRLVSDDSLADVAGSATPVVNIAATIAVKTEAECCNSHCCIDEDNQCKCCIQ